MDSPFGLIMALATIVVVILIMRLVGAWMLRINEVISNQDRIEKILVSILNEIKSKNS